MAWPEGGLWVAVCIDFSLAAQGKTLAEARAALSEQIHAYTREAFSIDAQHAEVLLQRRGPLGDRLKYNVYSFLTYCARHGRSFAALTTNLKARIKGRVYIEPLPLAPAA